jgi:hypothetical protein
VHCVVGEANEGRACSASRRMPGAVWCWLGPVADESRATPPNLVGEAMWWGRPCGGARQTLAGGPQWGPPSEGNAMETGSWPKTLGRPGNGEGTRWIYGVRFLMYRASVPDLHEVAIP